MTMTFWDFVVSAVITLPLTLAALLITLWVTFHIEKVKKPVFDLEVEQGEVLTKAFDGNEFSSKHLRVLVRNQSAIETNSIFGRWVTRNTAWKTRGEITVYDQNKQQVVEPFNGRWASMPEPVAPIVQETTAGSILGHVPDITKIALAEYQDIPAGGNTKELLDIAAKKLGDLEGYCWSNRNYFCPNKRDPHSRFDEGEYIVKVYLESGEANSIYWLKLDNREDAFGLSAYS